MLKENKKGNIPEITFVRAFCSIGIVIYHFLAGSRSGIEFMHNYPNGTWGAAYVTAFFVISGVVMYRNYSRISSVGRFWYKRFKSIFPMFYIAYIFCFLESLFKTGDPFPHGQPWCLIFSLLGIDGYVEGYVPTYYFIGEWFLGAIIIIYLIYPLLLWLFNKNTAVSAVVVLGLYIWMLYTPLFSGEMLVRNIFSCIMNFYVGMIAEKYHDKILGNKWVTLAALIYFIAANFLAMPGNLAVVNHLYGIAVFFLLYWLGGYIMRLKAAEAVFSYIAALSYPIFLAHHQIIFKVLGYQNPTSYAGTAVMFIITVVLTLMAAQALKVLAASVIESKLYKKIENKILKA